MDFTWLSLWLCVLTEKATHSAHRLFQNSWTEPSQAVFLEQKKRIKHFFGLQHGCSGDKDESNQNI